MSKKVLIKTKVKVRLGSVGNTEWWTNEDWKKHTENVKKLKKDGEYLKEVEYDFTVVHNELFDGPIENYKNNPNYTITEEE